MPQLSRATVNCRLVPGDKPDDVEATLVKTIGDPNVVVASLERDVVSAPSPIDKQLVAAIEQVSAKFWPGIPVTYERVSIKGFDDGVAYLYELVKVLAR